MKHPVRDRLLMLLYALASLCAAAALIAVIFGRITPDMISGLAAKLRSFPAATVKIGMAVLAAVLTVLGLSLISAMFPPKKKRSSTFAIQQNENGTVRISLKTIDALVQKCLSQYSELKVVTSSLFSDEETVRVDVHIVLLADISMPLAISALQKQITKYVEACSGVNVREVRVFVDGAMAGGEKAAQSKYALPNSVLAAENELREEVAEEPAFELPAAEEIPAELTQPAIDEAPAVEEATAAEEVPAVQEEPAVEEPAVELVGEEAVAEAAAVEEESPVQQIPAEETAPAAEETPEAAEAPVPEKKKKLFGFFAKK